MYEVIVTNVGRVYYGPVKSFAEFTFNQYKSAGESVSLYHEKELIRHHAEQLELPLTSEQDSL